MVHENKKQKWLSLDQGYWIPLASSFVIMFLLSLFVPWNTALSLGADEHYELNKAFALYKGLRLYDPIWNDQPPLHTAMLAGVFKVFGPDIEVARGYAMCYGWLFLSSFGYVILYYHGLIAAIFAQLTLISSPAVLELCFSVMLEGAAMATGITSFALLILLRMKPRMASIVSGMVFGLSLQVKLTSLIFFPLVLAWMYTKKDEDGKIQLKITEGIKHTTLFLFVATFSFVFVWSFFPEMTANLLLGSHFSDFIQSQRATNTSLIFDSWEWIGRTENWVTLALILLVSWKLPDRCYFCFPFLALSVALTFAFLHFPYWQYYQIHTSLGMVWLTTCFFSSLCKKLLAQKQNGVGRKTIFIYICIFSLTFSIWITEGGVRMYNTVKAYQVENSYDAESIIQSLKSVIKENEHIYSDNPILAFHAKRLITPNAIILPRKRKWMMEENGTDLWNLINASNTQWLLLRSNGDFFQEAKQISETKMVLGSYSLFHLIANTHH